MDQKLKNTNGPSLKKGHFKITFLKYNWKSIFFTFSNTDQNASKKISNSNYIALFFYIKTALKTDF